VFRLHVCNTFFLFLSGDSHVGQRRDGGREVVFEHGRSAAGARQVNNGIGERGREEGGREGGRKGGREGGRVE